MIVVVSNRVARMEADEPIAGGLAFGIGQGGGTGRIARAALGGLTGAMLGAAIYQVLGAFCFPQAKTEMPIAADSIARVLCQALTCLSTAVGAVSVDWLARRRSNHSRGTLIENHQPLPT